MIPPIENIKFGLAVAAVVLALGSSHLLDGPTDPQSEEDGAAALSDALAQAQAERPELWTDERRARAAVAVGIAARERP